MSECDRKAGWFAEEQGVGAGSGAEGSLVILGVRAREWSEANWVDTRRGR